MELSGQKVIVVGAGVGGLVAALAFRQKGADVTVLEQAEAISEVGAGLQISPNGGAVLQALGLADCLARGSVRAEAVQLRDYRRGKPVVTLDLARFAADQTYLFVHRADLIGVLATAVRKAGAQVRLLQRMDHVVPGRVPAVSLANGAQMQADLIVGADGLHSKARTALNGDAEPQFTGQVAWRATVPNDLGLGPQAQVFMAPHRHLVCYPLRGGDLVNIVAVQERAAWVAEGWNHQDDPDALREVFLDFGGQAKQLLDRVDQVHLWGLFRHPVAERWHGDGLAILGDAAHPTLPFLAQGANLAFEDAWTLVDSLAQAGSQAEGLSRYQSRRRDRAVRVIEAANGNAWKYHLSFPPVRFAAHTTMRLMGRFAPEKMVSQFDWLYRHDVTDQRSSSTQTGT
ncbi:FAD-dependent monooxygenase [Tropicibacter sp. Alg240-R139]|uniref:FAD-dependent monooxygenase n=1 Tax=Tropicibacter sp. Alg240-R139 TaxID=2305991 RepID=UPI0013DF1C8C|nr:FAD-dependent monooxygenase [Tropicibacter sp. Alg240-R139]